MDPMTAPDADWYARAYPVRIECSPGSLDERFAWFFRRFPDGQGRKLLDIGTGTGLFVGEAQRRRFDAWGVDYDARTIEWGSSQGIPNLVATPIKAFLDAQHAGSWDVVTLFEVLEHVDDPLAFARGLSSDSRRQRPAHGLRPNRNRWLIGGREAHDYPPHD